ncbi:hypothetical protein HaLaN_03078, partial [Haematococcus lacustris]
MSGDRAGITSHVGRGLPGTHSVPGPRRQASRPNVSRCAFSELLGVQWLGPRVSRFRHGGVVELHWRHSHQGGGGKCLPQVGAALCRDNEIANMLRPMHFNAYKRCVTGTLLSCADVYPGLPPPSPEETSEHSDEHSDEHSGEHSDHPVQLHPLRVHPVGVRPVR